MLYWVLPFLLCMAFYPLSYAKYNWNRRNKFGALGIILLVILSVLLPVLILSRR